MDDEDEIGFFPPYQVPNHENTPSTPRLPSSEWEIHWTKFGSLLLNELKGWLELRAPMTYTMLEHVFLDTNSVLFGKETLLSFGRRCLSTLYLELESAREEDVEDVEDVPTDISHAPPILHTIGEEVV